MRKRELEKRIDAAMENVKAEIGRNARSGGLYGRGLSGEGYAGGYLQALSDIDGLLRDVEPGDRRGYWRRDEED